MKKFFIIAILITIIVVLGVFYWGPKKEIVARADDSGATPEGIKSIVDASNQFAFELYSFLKNHNKDKNIFISPWSISSALSMVYEGAWGETAKEIQSVFHFPEDNITRQSAFAKIYNEVVYDQQVKKDKSYQLNMANATWAQKDYQFLEEYKDVLQRYYVAKSTNLDFVNDTENSRQTINKWVAEQTKDKIKDLIPPNSLPSTTRLVLTNAIYFKGDWVKQFDKKETKQEDFRTSPGNTVKVPMMKLTGEKAKFNYAENEKLQILELPYKGEEISMLVILPKEDNLESIQEYLTAEKLGELKNALSEKRVNVYFPKFKFETKYTLNKTLENMGMPTAFMSGAADFSGMDGTKDLFIGFVIHQAYVDVNEEGTEAAAATGVGMFTAIAPQITTFRADHPFLFLIQEKETSNILFLGSVMNPVQSQ